MTQSLSLIKIRNSKRLPVPSENSLSRQEAACESSSENNSEEGWREKRERWENRQGTLIYIFCSQHCWVCCCQFHFGRYSESGNSRRREREYDSVVFEREKEGKNPLTNFILCTHVFFHSRHCLGPLQHSLYSRKGKQSRQRRKNTRKNHHHIPSEKRVPVCLLLIIMKSPARQQQQHTAELTLSFRFLRALCCVSSLTLSLCRSREELEWKWKSSCIRTMILFYNIRDAINIVWKLRNIKKAGILCVSGEWNEAKQHSNKAKGECERREWK